VDGRCFGHGDGGRHHATGLINIVLAFATAGAGGGPRLCRARSQYRDQRRPYGRCHQEALAELGKFGKVQDVIYAIDALTMKIKSSQLPAIQALDFVSAAKPRCRAHRRPPSTRSLLRIFSNGLSTWDLVVINVTDFGFDNRQVEQDRLRRLCGRAGHGPGGHLAAVLP
jgi:hypothetical protein